MGVSRVIHGTLPMLCIVATFHRFFVVHFQILFMVATFTQVFHGIISNPFH